jgi:hypothetical protein
VAVIKTVRVTVAVAVLADVLTVVAWTVGVAVIITGATGTRFPQETTKNRQKATGIKDFLFMFSYHPNSRIIQSLSMIP